MKVNPRLLALLLPFGLAALLPAPAQELRIDHVTDEDPPYVFVAPNRVYHPELKSLWMRALQRPEAELQRLAADAIARGHQQGMPGLEDTVDGLARRLRGTPDEDVRRAVTAALVSLDARAAAADLAAAAAGGDEPLGRWVEPALARWHDPDAIQMWLARLAEPSTSAGRLLLAIDGLGTVRAVQARDGLQALLTSPRQPAPVRLAAARSLGQIHADGLAPLAEQLAVAPAGFDRLLAAALLARHTDTASLGVLNELAVDDDPAVATESLRRLLDIDPELVLPLAPAAAARPDANVRWVAARAYVARGDDDAIAALGPLLDDSNPSLRRYVAFQLREFAVTEPARRPAVLAAGEAMLRSDPWRGLEQAALLLGSLDHEPAAQRLLELLLHARGEVYVAAAWAIRKLELPEILPELLRTAELQLARYQRGELSPYQAGEQAGQFGQTFGQFAYRPADEYLRKFIPQGGGIGHGRAGAVWALGHLYPGQAPPDLTRLLTARLTDIYDIDPEMDYVRRMAAISLGRMKSAAALPELREFGELDGDGSLVGSACYWAIEQITGEPAPVVHPQTVYYQGWFLEPLDTSAPRATAANEAAN